MTASSTPAPQVLGRVVDAQTRCAHYAGQADIIALKFKCCGDFYPCYECHDEAVTHQSSRWVEAELNERAILCGVCNELLTIADYLGAERCPACNSEFNPGCKLHRHIYFDLPAHATNNEAANAGSESDTACALTTLEREQQ